MKNVIVVLSGPSGAGKGTIYNEIAKDNNSYRYVSSTTRQIRNGEKEGVDYEYITKEEFDRRNRNNYFLETVIYDHNYYGTPIPHLSKHYPKDVFFDVNVDGGISIKHTFPRAILIYILPPDVEELKKRMGDRGENRLEIAKKEIRKAQKYYDYLVVNDDLQKTVEQIKNIIEIEKTNKMNTICNQAFISKYY